MTRDADDLYDHLPVIYRMRDEELGGPLKAVLEIIGEQAVLLERDLDQLYDDLFIETAADWVVPYLGDLVGYVPVSEAGAPGDPNTPAGRDLNRVLVPRRDVAATLDHRSRKGTAALLEILSDEIADWPARIVEFFTLLGWTQQLDHQHPTRGGTLDLRNGDALDLLDGPFDSAAHTVEVRRPLSHHSRGRYDIPSLGLFVARLKDYSVTSAPACCIEREGNQCYTFSVLGNDAPLFTRAERSADDAAVAGPLNLPLPIRLRAFSEQVTRRPHRVRASGLYYGDGRSLTISVQRGRARALVPIAAENVIPADLRDWHAYEAPRGSVLVDPVRGRMVFPLGQTPRAVDVTYHYGFSASMGGGEYHRPLLGPRDARMFRVRQVAPADGEFANIGDAYRAWTTLRDAPVAEGEVAPRAAVIEVMDSRAYEERLAFDLIAGESLQLRAADRCRPTLRLLDYRVNQPDPFRVSGEAGSRFVLDGMLVAGRGIAIAAPDPGEGEAEGDAAADAAAASADSAAAVAVETLRRAADLCDVRIRHCTLVPGWDIGSECEPERPDEPSITISGSGASLVVEHSIVGSIWVDDGERRGRPNRICLSDSILDSCDDRGLALCDPEERMANAELTVLRTTVIGRTLVHAVGLAENSVFTGALVVARRQRGCVRFCHLPPGSRTPRRFHCVPDRTALEALPTSERPGEILRLAPEFSSVRYGTPAYLQLGDGCADEIVRGADDESELGAFHDLYQPQRRANLRFRLDEYTAAGYETGIIDMKQG